MERVGGLEVAGGGLSVLLLVLPAINPTRLDVVPLLSHSRNTEQSCQGLPRPVGVLPDQWIRLAAAGCFPKQSSCPLCFGLVGA